MISRPRFRKPVKEEQAAGPENSLEKNRPGVPEGMFRKCDGCGKTVYQKDVEEHLYTCPKCGRYFRVGPKIRIGMVADRGSFHSWDENIPETNPLNFPGYEEKLKILQEKTGLADAVVTGEADIRGYHTALGVMSPDFMMGSMGTVVGERITRMVERATRQSLPVVLFCCSGGARMQEGIISLMQMAKTSAAVKKHSDAGLFYLPILTDPTTGGVTASFAMLGDIILAEPGALIGFAGPRVIAQTIGQKLPEGFQRAEFLVEKGRPTAPSGITENIRCPRSTRPRRLPLPRRGESWTPGEGFFSPEVRTGPCAGIISGKFSTISWSCTGTGLSGTTVPSWRESPG